MLSPDGMWEDRFLYWTGPQSEAWNEAEKRLSNPKLRVISSQSMLMITMLNLIQRVLSSYACEDWIGITEALCLSSSDTVVDLGGGRGCF